MQTSLLCQDRRDACTLLDLAANSLQHRGYSIKLAPLQALEALRYVCQQVQSSHRAHNCEYHENWLQVLHS